MTTRVTTPPTLHAPCLDHIVVFAADLAAGMRWCEETVGVTPPAGGEHPLMGTHNRILSLSSAAHPRSYLEILAINPGATRSTPESFKRWFDLDDIALQRQVAQHGPLLIHWVASVPDVQARCAALAAQGVDRGVVTPVTRPTAHGLLQWQLTLRDDGQRLMDGCLPTLIQWGTTHPCDSLPPSGVQLESLALHHPQAAPLRAACEAIGVADQVTISAAAQPLLAARLSTPRGTVTLSSAVGG